MKVCFVTNQIFAWGKFGGFGSLTRTIASELSKRGVQVFAVVPQRSNQEALERLDGITVLGFPMATLGLFAQNLYKHCGAQIYHSEEPSIGTVIAQKAMPHSKHLVTCQDPRDGHDWLLEFLYEPWRRKTYFPASYLYETNYMVTRAVSNADAVFTQAKFVAPKCQQLYRLKKEPEFLPNPVKIPRHKPTKSHKPTVCFLARWDPRKRPELFFQLAKRFPSVKFIALGKSESETSDRTLINKYSNVANLEIVGFVDQFASDHLNPILEESWIMINTAARECLPVSFLEAAAYRGAILSCNNPDDFASRFGFYVEGDDFAEGLEFLLTNDRWRSKGEQGYEYVKENHELKKVINQHLAIYETILANGRN